MTRYTMSVVALLALAAACPAQRKLAERHVAHGPTAELAKTYQATYRVMNLTNSFRALNGKPALRLNPSLVQAARAYAEKLAAADPGESFGRNGEAHNFDGTTLARRVAATGYRFEPGAVGENVNHLAHPEPATPQLLAERSVERWTDSPAHRANLLSESGPFTHFGAWVARGKSGYCYAVQVLAKPAP